MCRERLKEEVTLISLPTLLISLAWLLNQKPISESMFCFLDQVLDMNMVLDFFFNFSPKFQVLRENVGFWVEI